MYSEVYLQLLKSVVYYIVTWKWCLLMKYQRVFHITRCCAIFTNIQLWYCFINHLGIVQAAKGTIVSLSIPLKSRNSIKKYESIQILNWRNLNFKLKLQAWFNIYHYVTILPAMDSCRKMFHIEMCFSGTRKIYDACTQQCDWMRSSLRSPTRPSLWFWIYRPHPKQKQGNWTVSYVKIFNSYPGVAGMGWQIWLFVIIG